MSKESVEEMILNGSKIKDGVSDLAKSVIDKKTKSRQAYKLAIMQLDEKYNKDCAYLAAKQNEATSELDLKFIPRRQELLDSFEAGKLDRIEYTEKKCELENELSEAKDKLQNKYHKLRNSLRTQYEDVRYSIEESDFTEA